MEHTIVIESNLCLLFFISAILHFPQLLPHIAIVLFYYIHTLHKCIKVDLICFFHYFSTKFIMKFLSKYIVSCLDLITNVFSIFIKRIPLLLLIFSLYLKEVLFIFKNKNESFSKELIEFCCNVNQFLIRLDTIFKLQLLEYSIAFLHYQFQS